MNTTLKNKEIDRELLIINLYIIIVNIDNIYITINVYSFLLQIRVGL